MTDSGCKRHGHVEAAHREGCDPVTTDAERAWEAWRYTDRQTVSDSFSREHNGFLAGFAAGDKVRSDLAAELWEMREAIGVEADKRATAERGCRVLRDRLEAMARSEHLRFHLPRTEDEKRSLVFPEKFEDCTSPVCVENRRALATTREE